MADIEAIARQFFVACETGEGWAGCQPFCTPDASFAAQSEPVATITTLQGYTDWMRGLLTALPDGRYEIRAFATDQERQTVCAAATFFATHTGEGGPVPPTGKSTAADYVYVMRFAGDRIAAMTKVWNAGWTMKELGWA